jgi:hypothetical protein
MNYKHECPDWDYAEIDETMPEFECCLCYKENEQNDTEKSLISTENT